MSLDWPFHPFGRTDSSRPLLPPDVPSGEQHRGAFPASIRSRWRQGALQAQPQMLQRATGWDGCGRFLSEGLRCITWNTRVLVGSIFSRQRSREFKLKNYLQNSWTTTTSFVSRKYMERTSFFKLSTCWLRDFGSVVLFFLTNEDRQSAYTGTFCLKKLLLHVFTCQGRDHLVNIQSGRHSLVVANVHFEPELTLRQLRGRLFCSPAVACISLWFGRYFG